MFQISETLMTTFNPLPKNWQWLIFQFICKVDNLVKSQKSNLNNGLWLYHKQI